MARTKEQADELACTYASLILADDTITADGIKKVLDAAGCKVDALYPALFEKYLEGKDLETVLGGIGAMAAAAPAPAAAAGGGGGAAPAKAEKKVVEEESDEDIGMSLFD
eukprot:TRINITY_DN114171_c0_g1_i1.p2 TRINITY_DN114171_c0_g1~~TRINITY_DN114171_c0_g1_i1.p2  ORF type:complete len:110 (+),score=30.31 TRINITY_DN114171_c0_g1_i1:56-385(+)